MADEFFLLWTEGGILPSEIMERATGWDLAILREGRARRNDAMKLARERAEAERGL